MPQNLSLPLPVVRRELTEIAQKRSTYFLRCACTVVPLTVTMIFLASMADRRTFGMPLVGSGAELLSILFWTLTGVLYALGPALCCSAITSEREKQTLGLLLISRLTPLTLVLEKIASRLVPLLTLIVASTPLFAVAFLMGGITLGKATISVGILLYTAVQIATVSVCVSSIVRTAIASFWGTYLTLLVVYFGGPVLSEMGLLPRMGPAGTSDSWFSLFPPYQEYVLDRWLEFRALKGNAPLLWVTVPSLLLTFGFLLVAWQSLLFIGDSGGLAVGATLKELSLKPWRWIRGTMNRNSVSETVSDPQNHVPAKSTSDSEIWSDYLAAYRPILWREHRTSPLRNIFRSIAAIVVLLVIFVTYCANARSKDVTEESAAFILFTMVLVMLAMMSLAVRVFAKERDRQTLESLLTLPVSNRELLRDKMANLNSASYWLAAPVALLVVGSNLISRTADRYDSDGMFTFCMVFHTVLYLHLVKWIAVLFGLHQKTQIRAMVGSLVCTLLLCFGPIALFMMGALMSGFRPDVGYCFFMSPIIVVTLGAFRDLSELTDYDGFLTNLTAYVCFNLCFYFCLTVLIRTIVLRRLPGLLGRNDDDTVIHRSPLGIS